MTHYIAKLTRPDGEWYIHITSDLYYIWASTLYEAINGIPNECDDNGESIEHWLSNLGSNNMTLIMSYTIESNPEFFL